MLQACLDLLVSGMPIFITRTDVLFLGWKFYLSAALRSKHDRLDKISMRVNIAHLMHVVPGQICAWGMQT